MQQKTSYSVCLLRYEVWQTIFCYFRPLFALLPHYWLQKLKFGKNVKKTPGDTIILHMCTINQDHMMHGSWDIKCKEQSFLSFLTLQTTQNFEKNASFYTCILQIVIMWCIVLEISSTTNNAQQTEFFAILGYFLQFWQIFKNTFFHRTPPVAVSEKLKAERVVRECSVKKVFSEILLNTQGNTCARISFLQS